MRLPSLFPPPSTGFPPPFPSSPTVSTNIAHAPIDKNEIDDFKVSLAGKSATVTATGKSLEDVQAIVAKPGKATEPWSEWAAKNAEDAAALEAAEAKEVAE